MCTCNKILSFLQYIPFLVNILLRAGIPLARAHTPPRGSILCIISRTLRASFNLRKSFILYAKIPSCRVLISFLED